MEPSGTVTVININFRHILRPVTQMDGAADILLRHLIGNVKKGYGSRRRYFSGNAVEETFFYSCLLQKTQAVKILQLAFFRRHPDRRVGTIVVLRVQEPVVTCVYILQGMERVPVCAVHPAVFFGSVAPLDLCLLM